MISGPTYSGKSIYVKQLCTSLVALVVFLAHIRSFVPAEAAVIGLTDRIFKRVSRKATMAVQQSAFMIDLYQISFMLRHATSRSLCIIDEFGKGILVPDGVGLLCAILHHVASQDVPPKTATHKSPANLVSVPIQTATHGGNPGVPGSVTRDWIPLFTVRSDSGRYLLNARPSRDPWSRAGVPFYNSSH
nr:DNA mismatch repair protein MSH5-like [Physcomitrium patens]|eukprot:XP_024400331.1 DNA mismatch repair protein MSH5-like [Physcomitrella patens]